MKLRIHYDRILFILSGVAFLVLCFVAGELLVSHY